MKQAISKDGTVISYERSGSGPAVILVDGALCSGQFGPMPKLAPLLSQQFTVYTYDRRGRGASGDTQPYAKERELEDIAALIDVAGGPAFLVGLSSGAALALEAATAGLEVRKVVAYEPPYVEDHQKNGGAAHQRHLQALIDADHRGGAVQYFMRSMVGVPAIFVVMMRCMPWIWRKLKAVAHTLPYDAAIMNEFEVPRARLASIERPVLVVHGSKTDDRLRKAAIAVAEAVPGSQHATLEGQTHNVALPVLAPVIAEFFRASADH